MRATFYETDTGRITRSYEGTDHEFQQVKDLLGDTFIEGIYPNCTHIKGGKAVKIEHVPDIAERMQALRKERDALLRKSDWTQLPDAELSGEEKQQWAAYRKALRRFPDTVDLNHIVWPVPPSQI